MEEQSKLNLKHVWLLISVFSLLLPVFMPSSANTQNFLENVIGTMTVTMFILSFPSSLFGLPVMLFARALFGVNPNSIEGLYLNLFLLFAFGFVQWFWIVPRLLRGEQHIQILNLIGLKTNAPLSEANTTKQVRPEKSQWTTPLERVFQEKDSK